jgi:hypothetical protein
MLAGKMASSAIPVFVLTIRTLSRAKRQDWVAAVRKIISVNRVMGVTEAMVGMEVAVATVAEAVPEEGEREERFK